MTFVGQAGETVPLGLLPRLTAVTHSADWRQVLDDVPKFASGGVTVLVSQLD